MLAWQHLADRISPPKIGPAIHLVNLIPSKASLATPAVPLVQAMLTRANLPMETVALAVCILDSLDAKFARTWRVSCPLNLSDALLAASSFPGASGNKRHTMPPTPRPDDAPRQLHIDSVRPELIVLAALVIAVKFLEDPQESTHYYSNRWGRGMWTNEQLNVTERCIMERLEYRIMPLYNEDYLTDAMVDMQLAGQQVDWPEDRQPTPPDVATPESEFTPSHSRSKTMDMGYGLGIQPMARDQLSSTTSRSRTPKPQSS
jgi:hypothetical protein